jgi:hypothetical protein
MCVSRRSKRSAVSTGRLSVLPRVHPPPIDLVVCQEPSSLRTGDLVSRHFGLQSQTTRLFAALHAVQITPNTGLSPSMTSLSWNLCVIIPFWKALEITIRTRNGPDFQVERSLRGLFPGTPWLPAESTNHWQRPEFVTSRWPRNVRPKIQLRNFQAANSTALPGHKKSTMFSKDTVWTPLFYTSCVWFTEYRILELFLNTT